MTVIAVFNQKGGVGKTTITANLAAAIARNGIEPLVIDLDPQAHLTALWQRHPNIQASIASFYQGKSALTDLAIALNDGIRFIPSHMDLARIDVIPSRQHANIRRLKQAIRDEMLQESGMPILIDCNPTLGILAFSALFAADLVLIPVAAEYLALNGARMLAQTLAGLETLAGHRERRYLINRYIEGRRTVENVVEALEESYPGEVLHTRIREHDTLVEAIGWGTDIFSFDPDAGASEDFTYLLDELIESGVLQMPSR